MNEATNGTSSARRSLLPREHGAYAQLGAPLAAAYAGGRPGMAGLLFGLAAAAAFLAHEPLLVLLGHRGSRAYTQEKARARRRVAWLAGAAATMATLGALAAPAAAATAALVPAVAMAALAGFVVTRKERTVAAELLAAVAFSGAALPVAIACGWPAAAALAAFAGWAAGFAAVVPFVWAVAHKRGLGPLARAAALLGPALAVAVSATTLGGQAIAAGAPLLAAAGAIALLRPAARSLRRVGWALALATVGSAVAVGAVALA